MHEARKPPAYQPRSGAVHTAKKRLRAHASHNCQKCLAPAVLKSQKLCALQRTHCFAPSKLATKLDILRSNAELTIDARETKTDLGALGKNRAMLPYFQKLLIDDSAFEAFREPYPQFEVLRSTERFVEAMEF